MATAYIKSGMPVTVYGYADRDGTEVEEICWYNTGKPVSGGFIDSLTDGDWEAMTEALSEESATSGY